MSGVRLPGFQSWLTPQPADPGQVTNPSVLQFPIRKKEIIIISLKGKL